MSRAVSRRVIAVTAAYFSALLPISAFSQAPQSCEGRACERPGPRLLRAPANLEDLEKRVEALEREAADLANTYALLRNVVGDERKRLNAEPASSRRAAASRALDERERRLEHDEAEGNAQITEELRRLRLEIDKETAALARRAAAEAERAKAAASKTAPQPQRVPVNGQPGDDAPAPTHQFVHETVNPAQAKRTREEELSRIEQPGVDRNGPVETSAEVARDRFEVAAVKGQSSPLIDIRLAAHQSVIPPERRDATDLMLTNGFRVERAVLAPWGFRLLAREVSLAPRSAYVYRRVASDWVVVSWHEGDTSYYRLALMNEDHAGSVLIASPLNGNPDLTASEKEIVAKIACSAFLGDASLPCAKRRLRR